MTETTDAIMALADALLAAVMTPIEADQRASLRAAVEQVVREREEAKDYAQETAVMWSQLRERAERAEQEAAELRALARRIIALYPDDCRLDHHGYCQEHFLEENCTIKATKDALSRIDAMLAAR